MKRDYKVIFTIPATVRIEGSIRSNIDSPLRIEMWVNVEEDSDPFEQARTELVKHLQRPWLT